MRIRHWRLKSQRTVTEVGKRWTKTQDAALLDGVGVFSLAWFRKRSGQSYDYPHALRRSRMAVYNRATRLIGSGSLTRGTSTLAEAERETGYAAEQLQRAQAALNQKWKRLSPRGPYLITFDQLDEVVGWLRNDYWCAKLRLYGCVNCGDNHKPARGMGLCQRCYHRTRRILSRLGLPKRLTDLSSVVQALDGLTPEVRAFVDMALKHLERGWSLTENQIQTLLTFQR